MGVEPPFPGVTMVWVEQARPLAVSGTSACQVIITSRCHGIETKWMVLSTSPGACKLGSNGTGDVVALSTLPFCERFLIGSSLHSLTKTRPWMRPVSVTMS